MSGGSLKKLGLEQSIDYRVYSLSTTTILGWCADLASVLAHLHEECIPPIIHRDIKLDNVMFTTCECYNLCIIGTG